MTRLRELLSERGQECRVARELRLRAHDVEPRYRACVECELHQLQVLAIAFEQRIDSRNLRPQRRNLQRLVHCIASDAELGRFDLALLILGERPLLFDRAADLAGVVERVAHGGADREIRERRRLRQRSEKLSAVLLAADARGRIELRPVSTGPSVDQLLALRQRPLLGCEPPIARQAPARRCGRVHPIGRNATTASPGSCRAAIPDDRPDSNRLSQPRSAARRTGRFAEARDA